MVQELFDKLYNRRDADLFMGVAIKQFGSGGNHQISWRDDTEGGHQSLWEMDFTANKYEVDNCARYQDCGERANEIGICSKAKQLSEHDQ